MGRLEDLGATDAIHSLLMQNDEDVLRLFPGRPDSVNAGFTTLRAMGAFLVSARYTASRKMVSRARVVSEVGQWDYRVFEP